MIEIERKFLVISEDYKTEAISSKKIVQGFLNTHKKRTVRVRIVDSQGFLTIKGKSSKDGTSRFEWETEIELNDAKQLLKLCEKEVISKVRYEVKVGEHVYEIDEFKGSNNGLTIAEIELKDVSENFKKPDWLGKEVTGKTKYYNSQLSKNPYSRW